MIKLLRFVYFLIIIFTLIHSSSPCITFHDGPYVSELLENSPGGTIILSINISGYDTNNPVTFTLSNYENLFALNPVSQHTQLQLLVRAGAIIDREVVRLYEFNIEAVRHTQMCADAAVFIIIQDECDVAPEFFSPLNIFLSEDSAINESLYTFTAIDDDTNQIIMFTIADPTNTFTIGPYDGILSLLRSLDCEQTRSYTILITASDNCQPVLSTSQYFIVNISNVNDEIPEFLQGCCYHSVAENSPNGTVIGTVSARDGDICHIVDVLTWVIQSGNAGEVFRINPNTGELIVNNPNLLNRESISNYSILIQIYEGDNMQFATSTVLIEITDINDNTPVFIPVNTTIEQQEGAISGTLLFQLNATDGDLVGSINSEISYFILSEGNINSIFSIGITTGVVQCNVLLDREIYSDPFLLAFIAVDHGTPSLTATSYVQFILIDINDNSPAFNATQYNVSVYENSINTIITTIRATDADIDNNARLSYMLTQNPNNYFHIDTMFGILSTTNVIIDREETQSVTLTIMATDGGTPQLFGNAKVLVNVIDINDNTPEFSQTSYLFTTPEELPPNQIIFDTPAIDLDDNMTNNGRVSYYIISGSMGGAFYMNGSTILTLIRFNREMNASYSLLIGAMDEGIPSKSSTASVTISILDINDNTPQFTRDRYIVGFSQDAEFATEIIQIQATDADLAPYNIIVYALADSLQDFSFTPSNGKLYTNRLFSDSIGKRFTFTVIAYDNSNTNPTNSNSTSLEVVVLRREDRVILIVEESVSVAEAKIDTIKSVLEEITGAIINIEFIKPRSSAITCTPSGDVLDISRSEIVFHAFDKMTGELISPDVLIRRLDENSELLFIFGMNNFQSVSACPATPESILFPLLISLVSLLGACLVITCCILCCIMICVRIAQKHAASQKEDRFPFFPSMSTLSTLTSSSAFNRSDVMVTDNPMFRHPYDDLISQASSMPTPVADLRHQYYLPDYETQELIIDLFSHSDTNTEYSQVSDSNANMDENDESDAITSLIPLLESATDTQVDEFDDELNSNTSSTKTRPDSFELIRAAVDSYEDYISDSSDNGKSVL